MATGRTSKGGVRIIGLDRFQRKVRRFPKRLNAKTISIIRDYVDDAKVRAKADAPVKTGFHQRNIRKRNTQQGANLEANAPYAAFLEFGTRKMAARPHLFPAIEFIRPVMLREVRKAVDWNA